MSAKLIAAASATLVGGTLLLVGCGQKSPPPEAPRPPGSTTAAATASTAATSATADNATGDDEHGHVAGAHGGIIASLGRDSYHVEAVFEKGGVLRLYVLGADESRIQEVERQALKAYVKAADATESHSFEFKPEPQEGDTEGKTSVFVGTLPADLAGGELDVTVPSMKIAGERFRLGFTSAPQVHGDDDMPAKVSDDAERELYLTAAGVYTEADVQANGNQTASEKFKGFRAKHDMKPKPGDKICPVTMTKANPACTWIIAGKEYEFCCPPCVDEFVSWAKDPELAKDILPPEEYVKK
jgi:predicted extracellular nuclease